MKIEYLRRAIEDAFPHIHFSDGPPAHVDSRGAVYTKYALGTRSPPDDAPLPATHNIAMFDLTRLFYLDLHERIRVVQPKHIEWRRAPTIVESADPNGGQVITCRFSMRAAW